MFATDKFFVGAPHLQYFGISNDLTGARAPTNVAFFFQNAISCNFETQKNADLEVIQMTVNLSGVVQQPGQGSSYWVLGDLYTFKAVGEDTGNAYALVEIIVQPQSGTPPHIHSHENEAFYIQQGELEFQLDEQILVATPGTFLHSPKGQLHRFTNTTTQTAKLLCWVTPAGLEKFFMEIGVPAAGITHSPGVSPADIEKVMVNAQRYGLEIIPPPSKAN